MPSAHEQSQFTQKGMAPPDEAEQGLIMGGAPARPVARMRVVRTGTRILAAWAVHGGVPG